MFSFIKYRIQNNILMRMSDLMLLSLENGSWIVWDKQVHYTFLKTIIRNGKARSRSNRRKIKDNFTSNINYKQTVKTGSYN